MYRLSLLVAPEIQNPDEYVQVRRHVSRDGEELQERRGREHHHRRVMRTPYASQQISTVPKLVQKSSTFSLRGENKSCALSRGVLHDKVTRHFFGESVVRLIFQDSSQHGGIGGSIVVHSSSTDPPACLVMAYSWGSQYSAVSRQPGMSARSWDPARLEHCTVSQFPL